MSMSSEEIGEQEVDRELMDLIAEDSIKLFSVNLVILTFFVTLITFSYREGGLEYLSGVIDSTYSITVMMFWLGSLIGSIITYRFARRTRLKKNYSNRGRIPDEQNYLNQVSAVALGSLLAVYCFIIGLIDGLSDGSIGIEQPIFLAGFALFFVLAIFNVFSVIDVVRNTKFDELWERLTGGL